MRNPDTQIYNTISELVDGSTRQTYPTGTTTSTSERWTHSPQVAYTSPWTDTSEGPFSMNGTITAMSQDEVEEIFSRGEPAEPTLESYYGFGFNIFCVARGRNTESLGGWIDVTINTGYTFREQLDEYEFIKFNECMRHDMRGVAVDYLINLLRDIRKKPQKSFTQWFMFNMWGELNLTK